LTLFKRATRQTPESSPRLWDAWRTEQVTQLVRDIRGMVNRVSPNVCLSAAVGASPDEAKRRHFQDSRRWAAEGLLDTVFPMNYAPDTRTFDRRLKLWAPLRSQIPVVTGIMFDQRDAATVIDQVHRARKSTPHFAAFAYNSLFERPDRKGRLVGNGQSASRATLSKRVIPYLRRLPKPRV
jgi:uncharacterized lipoprotein YddW (UPF0748 family)